MNSSLIYKSPMIANEFSFEQSKPLPLGKRLIDACITNETTTRSSYLVFYVTSKSFTEDWEKFLDSIFSDLTEQELDDRYGVTSIEEARSNQNKWKANLLGDNRLGYLIVRVETPFKKRASKISYIDSMTYVCTTPPNQKGQEKVIVPQVKEDPSIVIQCLKSDSYMQDPFQYTVRLAKGFATYKGIDGKQREFLFDGLSKIKSQLFDAPADVKASFNEVVKYFDRSEDLEELEYTESQIKRAASQWSRDHGYGDLGVDFIMKSYFGTPKEYDIASSKLRSKFDVDVRSLMSFESDYLK